MSGEAGHHASRGGRLAELARRKQRLVADSARWRARLATDVRFLEGPLQWADRTRDALAWVARRPWLVAGGSAALLAWRPRQTVRWALRVWGWWQVWQRVRQGPSGPAG